MKAFTILLTGYSGAGKSTLAKVLKEAFLKRNVPVELLDGDIIRKHLTADLGFSKEDRLANAKRIGFLANMLTKHGINVIIAMIAPYSDSRDEIRRQVNNYREIYVKCPIEVCEKRDVKGLYQKARNGEILHFTGVSDPYEKPVCPDVICETNKESIPVSVRKILRNLNLPQEREIKSSSLIPYRQL